MLPDIDRPGPQGSQVKPGAAQNTAVLEHVPDVLLSEDL